jgi:Zn-dependent protease
VAQGGLDFFGVAREVDAMLTSGSLKLFTVAGTVVRVHPTFFLLLAWIAALHWLSGGPEEAVRGVIFIIILFACVVLHEFGHIFAARRYGIRTPDVTLLPIGGVASLERMPEKPGQEIVVALAGPAVNLVIAVVLVGLFGASLSSEQMARLEVNSPSLLDRVAAANVALFVFNLIPAFPMDGGRVLRALLAIPLGFTRATQVAAMIGQVFAIGLGFLGLFGNPLLVIVAAFIFMAASAEAGYVQARDLARGYLASHAMITSFEPLSTRATADDAATLLLRTTQQDFPVVDVGQRLRGIVTRQALISALKEQGGSTSVLDFMSEVPVVPEKAGLETVMETLNKSRVPAVGVVDRDGRFLGYINSENLGELIMIRSARTARETPA